MPRRRSRWSGWGWPSGWWPCGTTCAGTGWPCWPGCSSATSTPPGPSTTPSTPSPTRPRTGASRSSGVISRRAVAVAAVVAGVASLGFGLALGPATFALAVVGLACAWSYDLWLKGTVFSALPFAVAVPVVPLFGYGAAGRFPAVLWWAWPIGALLAVATHLADALPDVEHDRATGVRGWPPASGSAGRPRSRPRATAPPWSWPCTRGWPPGTGRWWWPGRPWPSSSAWPPSPPAPAARPAAGSPTGSPGRHGRPRPRLGRRRPSLTEPDEHPIRFRPGGGCGQPVTSWAPRRITLQRSFRRP